MMQDFLTAERAIVGDIWTSTSAWHSMRALCDDFNGRFVASDDERNAAAFIASKLTEYGLSNVHTEAFSVQGWKRGPASFIAGKHAFECIALPGTPAGDITAQVMFIGDGEVDDFARAGKAAKGRIAVVRGNGSHRLEKYSRAMSAGCVGFVFGGTEPGCLPPTGSLDFGGKPAPLPGIGVSYENIARLERVLSNGPLEAQLRIECESFPAEGLNVIGDIPGTDPNAGTIMLCAHYDGHDIAQGAVDNASGTVAVMEAARALMQVREHLKLGIRVALWSGEEIGMIGSQAYANAHRRELKQIKFVFNCDIVANSGALWLGINGLDCDRLVAFFNQLAANQVHNVMPTTAHVVPYSDHFSFFMKGVPALMAYTAGAKVQHAGPHTWGDTLDKVDMRGLRSSTAFTARALFHLAHDPSPLPAQHATKAEVQEMLRNAGYEPLLKAQGRWKF
jgi:Zn-dependent M28 family amino/carboxypeptidase